MTDQPPSTLRSWIPSANLPGNGFPIQNLPWGVFLRSGWATPHIGVAIGGLVFDLFVAAEAALLGDLPAITIEACRQPTLNPLMACSHPAWSQLRRRLQFLLQEGSEWEPACRHADTLLPRHEAVMLLPAAIGDYTDFYASIDHATHIGSMFRPDNPLLPNYQYVPVAYHGRASTVRVSGAAVRRPCGQILPAEGAPPVFAPSRRLDYELEVGFFVGPGNPDGEPIPIARAEEHIFGLCLLNDWSARDIQRWEYQPLGPFLAKNFATTISPWIVPLPALEPFRLPARPRATGDPAPLPYLFDPRDQQHGGLDLTLEVWLQTAAMANAAHPPVLLSRGNFRSMYWTLAQMLTHHASNGCVLRSGDLIGSGTVSGPDKGQFGCLQELTWGGRDPVSLPGGELRRSLEDGDTVILRGHAHRPGHPLISLGACHGQITPASPQASPLPSHAV